MKVVKKERFQAQGVQDVCENGKTLAGRVPSSIATGEKFLTRRAAVEKWLEILAKCSLYLNLQGVSWKKSSFIKSFQHRVWDVVKETMA